MKQSYSKEPLQVIQTKNLPIYIFETDGQNIDTEVVKTFGEEWLKFKDYSDDEIESSGRMYFDIIDDKIINKNVYGLDIGCGTGRWTKFLSKGVGFLEAIDPSDAIFAAAELLKDVDNVRLSKASIEKIPFADGTFDFVMSVGVLHHIPDTQKAMIDCVKKLKKDGYFFCYLYYNLESKSFIYQFFFRVSNLLRLIVSSLPSKIKRIVCDFLAVVLYMPFIITGKVLQFFGFKKLAKKIPLYDYIDKTFFIVRNDSLDRFGTKLEQRFSKQQVIELMEMSGLKDIVVSPSSPYYHAVGRRDS